MSAPGTAIYVQAIGLAAPGLPNWAEARALLRGERAYVAGELPPYQPQLLPANERRRAGGAVRLAFRAAEDAMQNGVFAPKDLATVFASSDADTPVIHRICSALAEPARMVSPTDFHNSVHNAAAGYWSIATACAKPSTSLSAWDWSFAAGLLEAFTWAADGAEVLLVAYDIALPAPLLERRPIAGPFATALVLSARATPGCIARIAMSIGDGSADTIAEAGLEALRVGNPAARALPLLQALARGIAGEVLLPTVGDRVLRVRLATP
ncbi:MAG: hypothetical protein JWQ90_2301 [Hydrocarboniphaga sp.]|uniref:beta-ketoacyl synthase chain length factor n=1 Tax=Hydrocarboniphaga sp. TaxID=2033016 RepID=UPI00261B0A49|nr:beta-ketoacyl synthase chain length factor [Hydrocarboniphaga sp.]MDB5969851.1 hypothetical protein [Hydrocarboniphaga sp.]